jgi:septal ring factor EnvC (AmiA/AmiB activator)
MSDFLKKLKGVFVVDDGTASEVEETKKAEPQVTTAPVRTVAPSITAGNVSEKFTDILLESMERNNQEGFDYIEYKRSLQTLEKMPMDEKTRYFSAFAAAQSMGISQQKLIDSAKFYLGILKTEEQQFQNATKGQREKQIGGKEKTITSLANTIQEKGELIAKLTQEIQQHQTDMDAMKAEIQEAVVKIDTTMEDFHASYTNLEGQINGDIAKMETYLK